MSLYHVIKNKDLIYDVMNYDAILVGTSTYNALGNGFQHKVARSFPDVNRANKETFYADKRKIGTVKVVRENPAFCLCYIHNGRFRPDRIPDVVDYEGLERCLKKINEAFKGKKVASTIIGHSPYEGGGDRERCFNLMISCLTDVDLYIYDYEQVEFRNEDNHNYFSILEEYKANKISKDEYYERMRRFLWEKHYGLYTPMPDMTYKEMVVMFRKERKKKKFENLFE